MQVQILSQLSLSVSLFHCFQRFVSIISSMKPQNYSFLAEEATKDRSILKELSWA